MDISLAHSVAHHWEGRLVERARTDIETPHVLETPFLITAAKYPSHIVDKDDGVRESREWGVCLIWEPYSNTSRVEVRARHWGDEGSRENEEVDRGLGRGKTLRQRRQRQRRVRLSLRLHWEWEDGARLFRSWVSQRGWNCAKKDIKQGRMSE